MKRVEKDWHFNDLRCVVIMTSMGHRCGYVGVPIEHPLFAVNYSESIPDFLKSKIEEVKEGPIGKRGILSLFCADFDNPSLDMLFDVHGSLTYSGGGLLSEYPVNSNLWWFGWWFGYDCAHCDDGNHANPGLPIRSLGYCIGECESLAKQLEEIKELGK